MNSKNIPQRPNFNWNGVVIGLSLEYRENKNFNLFLSKDGKCIREYTNVSMDEIHKICEEIICNSFDIELPDDFDYVY